MSQEAGEMGLSTDALVGRIGAQMETLLSQVHDIDVKLDGVRDEVLLLRGQNLPERFAALSVKVADLERRELTRATQQATERKAVTGFAEWAPKIIAWVVALGGWAYALFHERL